MQNKNSLIIQLSLPILAMLSLSACASEQTPALINISQNSNGLAITTITKITSLSNAPQATTAINNITDEVMNMANNRTYDHLIVAAANRHGVNPALVKAVIHTESNFNPRARSRAGAMGLMQLMPATARSMGVSNAWDPAQNIEGGVKLLALLQEQYDDIDLILAAYNAGSGNVKKYGGIPPFKETRNYVKKVTNRYTQIYANDTNLARKNNNTHLAMNSDGFSSSYTPRISSSNQLPTVTKGASQITIIGSN